MEIKMKKINNKSPKNYKSKSIDKYKEFLGNKKDIKNSKDKKVLHVTRKRVSPKKIKKVNNPRDILQIENNISKKKSNIRLPTQNENMTSKLNKSINKPIVKPTVKPAVKPTVKPTVKPIVKPAVKPVKKKSRSISRNNTRSKKRNRRVSIKNSTFKTKDIKDVESKIKLIQKKKIEDIKKELEIQGVKVTSKSNKLVRDIYLYSKMCNINITHES